MVTDGIVDGLKIIGLLFVISFPIYWIGIGLSCGLLKLMKKGKVNKE